MTSRTLLVLALALSSSCLGECSGVGAIGSLRAGDMTHGDARGDMVIPRSGVQAVYYAATFTPDQNARPVCTTAESCVLQCYVSTGTTWACVDGDGATVTVTQGTGATAATTPYASETLTDIDNTKAPQLAGAVADAFRTVWTAPHTIVIQGYGTTLTDATYQYLFSHEAVGGLGIRQEGANTAKCIWSNKTTTANTGFRNGWSQFACRKTGTGASSEYDAIGDNYRKDDTAATDPAAVTAGTPMYFGRRSSTFPLRGGIASVTLYSASKDDTFLAAQQSRWNATTEDGVALGFTAAASAATHAVPRTHRDVDGYIVQTLGSQPRVDQMGLYLEHGHTNSWAADALDASSWTDVGTPTVTANVSSGPFSRQLGTAEADRIVDDDGAAFEGKQSTGSSGTKTTGKHTASCLVALGDSGTVTDKIRMVVTTDGTGSTSCDLDIDSGGCTADALTGWYRCECSAAITGSPTYVRGQVLVGNATTDTGSVIVSQCQIEPEGWASSPKSTNTARAEDRVTVPSSEWSTWFGGDMTAGGEVEIVWQTDKDDADRDATEAAIEDAQYLLDMNDGGGHAFLLYRLPQSSGACTADKWCVQMLNSGCAAADYTTLSDSTVSISAGQWYATRVTWTPAGSTQTVKIYHDSCADPASCSATTQVGSATGKCQTDITVSDVSLGRRYSNTRDLDGHIYRITVSDEP